MNRLGPEKLIYHLEQLLEIKEKGDTFPVHMAVGLTEYCCHKCIFCYSEFATADTTKKATMDKEVLLRFLKEAKSYGLKAVTLIGAGEPLLHPQIVSILYEIRDIGLDIGIFTNGSRIKPELRTAILDTCTFVRFSVNAGNAEEHEKVHRVKNDFENVVNNIRLLVNEKRERQAIFPTLGTQMVFYEDNYKSIYEAAKRWKTLGIDYFAIKPVISGEGNGMDIAMPAKNAEDVKRQMELALGQADENFEVYAKYDQYIETQREHGRKYRKCYGQALEANLWADGNLFFCPNREQTEDIIGNIYERSFLEIWHGEKRMDMLKNMNFKRCVKGCRCHFMNEFIEDCFFPDESIHPNFI